MINGGAGRISCCRTQFDNNRRVFMCVAWQSTGALVRVRSQNATEKTCHFSLSFASVLLTALEQTVCLTLTHSYVNWLICQIYPPVLCQIFFAANGTGDKLPSTRTSCPNGLYEVITDRKAKLFPPTRTYIKPFLISRSTVTRPNDCRRIKRDRKKFWAPQGKTPENSDF